MLLHLQTFAARNGMMNLDKFITVLLGDHSDDLQIPTEFSHPAKLHFMF